MASFTISTPPGKSASSRQMLGRITLLVPTLLASLFLGMMLVPTGGGDGERRLYAIFYLGWMYFAIRLTWVSITKTTSGGFVAALGLMILAPFLTVLALIIIDRFIHPL